MRILYSHLNLFRNGFDPVKDVSNERNERIYKQFQLKDSKWNYHFLSPLTVITIAVVKGLIGFDNENQSLKNALNFNSNQFVSHLIFPREVWQQSDIILGISVLNMFACYWNFYSHTMINAKYHMKVRKYSNDHSEPIVICLNKVLNPRVARRILAIRQQFRRVTETTFFIWFIGAESYFKVQLLTQHNLKWDVVTTLYWSIISPMFVLYGVFTNILLIMYFLLTLKYIHVKQRSFCEQMRQLMFTLMSRTFTQTCGSKNFANRYLSKWRVYRSINIKIVRLCHEIEGYDHFWSRYLTFSYLLNIGFICYSMYALFIVKAGLVQKSFFILMISCCTILLFVVIKHCADVGNYNSNIDRLNAYCQLYFGQTKFSPLNHMLKLETIMVNRTAKFYGCKLLNDYLIKTITLLETFYIISTFFMLNFRKQTSS